MATIPSPATSVPLAAGIVVLASIVYTIVYRIYLTPLARFPGPKLAAVSKAYQFYFDVLKAGKLPFELVRLHERYGSTPFHRSRYQLAR